MKLEAIKKARQERWQKMFGLSVASELYGTAWKTPKVIVNLGVESYNSEISIVLGMNHPAHDWCETETDLYESLDYVKGHEVQHTKSTTRKAWNHALRRGTEVVIEELCKAKGIHCRLSTDHDYEEACKKLSENGLILSIPVVKNFVHFITNSLEDGRIEAIRSAENAVFKQQVIHIRLLGWKQHGITAKEGVPYEKLDEVGRLGMVLNQILSLSTESVFQKGFAERYFGTPLEDKVRECIPHIAKGVTAKNCRDMSEEAIEICKILALMIGEASMRPEFNKQIQWIKTTLAELGLDDDSAFADEQNEAEGDGSNTPFGNSDLYVILPDDEYDKLMDKMKDKEQSENENGSTMHIRREHPKEDEETSNSNEQNSENGSGSSGNGQSEGGQDENNSEGNPDGNNSSSSQDGNSSESAGNSQLSEGSDGSTGSSSSETSDENSNSDSADSSGQSADASDSQDTKDQGNSGSSNGSDSKSEKSNGDDSQNPVSGGSSCDSELTDNESMTGCEGNEGDNSTDGENGKDQISSSQSQGTRQKGSDSGVDHTGEGCGTGDTSDEALSEVEKAIEEQMKEAAEAAAGMAQSESEFQEKTLSRQEKEQSMAQDQKEPITKTSKETVDKINSALGNTGYRLSEKERAYEVDELIDPALMREIQTFQRTLESLMKSKRYKTRRGLMEGRLDSTRCAMLAAGEVNVFKETKESKGTSACAELILDNSGSMGYGAGSKREAACKALAKIEMAFAKYFPIKMLAFDASGDFVIHEIIKNWKEHFSRSAAWNFLTKGRYGSSNNDAFSIRVATADLLTRNEKRKLLVVLSDGAPCYGGEEDVRDAVREARRKGITVVGIYFADAWDIENGYDDSELFKRMYEKDYIICEPDQITENLARVLKKFFL